MKPIIFFLSLLAVPATAQEPTLFDYLREHVSVVSGVAIANGEKSEFVSLSLDHDFLVKNRLRGFAGLALFGRQRAAGLPASVEDLALYSAGRGLLGAYFKWVERVGFECRGAMTFEMTGIVGKVGEPVDGSKVTAACGIRLTGGPGRLSLLGGHAGPVDEGRDLWGFVPSLVVSGSFRLPKNSTFLVDVSAGRDRLTSKRVTSAEFAVGTRF